VADLRRLEDEDARCLLLAVSAGTSLEDNPALLSYVEDGEAGGVHLGYKCSIRRKWWVVPSVWTPDAFLLRQIYDHPRIIANLAGATSTDTIHRVRTRAGTDPRSLAAASINSATFAFSEVLGRSYGGGVLELEPREAEELPFPPPASLSAADIARVEELVGAGRLLEALDLVDRVLLLEECGMSKELVEHLRALWSRLRDRRLARGKGSRKAAVADATLAA